MDNNIKNIDYKNIIYNLETEDSANDYYLTIENFTDIVLNKAKEDIGEIVSEFQLFLTENSVENIYIGSYLEEHIFEALYLGVLWKLYINKAIELDPFNQKIMSKLSHLRNKKDILNSPYKSQIDDIRGPLATKFLFNLNDKNNNETKMNHFQENFNLKLDLLLDYLEAIGDYKESLKHLKLWKDFLISKDEKTSLQYFNSIVKFTDWFENIGKKELNSYTPNIDSFKNNYIKNHIDNEDIILCNRSELEYHINLIAAEIMSRIFQKEFKNKEKIAILLPTCMKIPNSECLAIEDNLGLKCMGCNKDCNIGKVSKQFNNDHNSVYIVTHASSILSNLTKDDKDKIGIVGVACINNLIEGGWKITSCGIPPQCVILDYVGCKNHWTPEDIETNFNIDKLKSTVL